MIVVKRFVYEVIKNKIAIIIIFLLLIIIFFLGICWTLFLRKAHSTFENYYAFRGCVQLLDRTPDYGICKITSGQVIKIVKFQNRWYLDGDLPVCLFNICF
jgi:hypothetical protein